MLTQSEADALLGVTKRFVAAATIAVSPGADDTHELVGDVDGRDERFLLDVWRGTRRIAKLKYQTRAQKVYVLARLDLNGAPHTNPDGTRIGGTHLHIYRQGFDAKWAFPLDSSSFSDPSDPELSFHEFCTFCHVQNGYVFQAALQ